MCSFKGFTTESQLFLNRVESFVAGTWCHSLALLKADGQITERLLLLKTVRDCAPLPRLLSLYKTLRSSRDDSAQSCDLIGCLLSGYGKNALI